LRSPLRAAAGPRHLRTPAPQPRCWPSCARPRPPPCKGDEGGVTEAAGAFVGAYCGETSTGNWVGGVFKDGQLVHQAEIGPADQIILGKVELRDGKPCLLFNRMTGDKTHDDKLCAP
jgi:hypothetical protein